MTALPLCTDMLQGGIFVTLYDKETLKLYLDQGIYGQHMTPQEGEPSSYSAHYRTFADYGAVRDGYHVFFSLNREIYYGGQIRGSDEHGAFYINGQKSPMGREADAPLVWDESDRDTYEATDEPGVFKTDDDDTGTCQPFLVQFEDGLDLAGAYVTADQFYLALGNYPYLLPAHDLEERNSFTLTPGEVNTLVELLKTKSEGHIEPLNNETVEFEREPIPYSPMYGIGKLSEARSQSHLESSILANPSLLPKEVCPAGTTICRNMPISPFRPRDIDRADVSYFHEETVQEGTIPNAILYPRNQAPEADLVNQIDRQLQWLDRLLGLEAKRIVAYVLTPRLSNEFAERCNERLVEKRIECLTYSEGCED